MYNGELSDAMIVDKKTFVRSCQAFRPKQFFKDFTNADINYNNTYLKEKITNGCISILGKDEYLHIYSTVSLVGARKYASLAN
jgi:hypothetical protein